MSWLIELGYENTPRCEQGPGVGNGSQCEKEERGVGVWAGTQWR